MTKPPPVVYILHGEDEFAIAQFAAELEAKLGDSPTASMNTARLDGRAVSFDDLRLAANSLPFLTPRRLVIVTHPLAKINHPSLKDKFEALLDQLPASTALVLIEHKTLPGNHWLLFWAKTAAGRSFVRNFSLQKGQSMVKWIQDQAVFAGGKLSPQAAALLASLVGEDARLAYQEVHKLMAYTNYQRTVEPEDVENLTISASQGDIFAMVDALGNRNGRQAMRMLHRLMEEQDPLSIFGMIVRQFRLLLLAREVLDQGGGEGDAARLMKIHPFVAGKIVPQARRFDLPTLERAYHRLLEIDESIKTSQIDGSLALDTLVASFTM